MLPNKLQFPRRLPLPGVLLTLAVLTGVWAIWVFARPVVRLEEPADHPGHFGLVYAHALGGIAIQAVGLAALFLGWTKRRLRWHRALGRVYLIAGGAGALAFVVLSVANTHADPVLPFAVDLVAVSETGWALATQGVAWMLFAAMAYRAARKRRFDAHRDWMVRSYVVAWGFVLRRLGRSRFGPRGARGRGSHPVVNVGGPPACERDVTAMARDRPAPGAPAHRHCARSRRDRCSRHPSRLTGVASGGGPGIARRHSLALTSSARFCLIRRPLAVRHTFNLLVLFKVFA